MWDRLPEGHGDPLNGPYTTIFLIAFLFIKTFEYNGGMGNLAQRYTDPDETDEVTRNRATAAELS